MALPYFYPPAVTFGPGVASMSSESVNQIYQQHNIQTMAYLRNGQYLPPLRYNFTPLPFKPYYPTPNMVSPQTCHPDSLPFSHNVPNMIYPITPRPVRPVPPYTVSPLMSYQSQLRLVVKRVADSDARVKAESKRLKAAEGEFKSLRDVKGTDELSSINNNRPLDSILISDDDVVENPKPLSGSRMNPLYGGNGLTPIPTYEQQLLLQPGLGQQYISKIRTLVEGAPTVAVDIKKNPSTKKISTKEKKVRRKSTNIKENPSKRRKTHENNEVDSKFLPSTWHTNPDLNATDHLVLGSNGTIISRSFYNTIPWKTFKISTRILVQYYFTPFALATQRLDGENPLDKNIIEDIVSHIMTKCSVGRDSVRSKIAWICADEALKRRLQV